MNLWSDKCIWQGGGGFPFAEGQTSLSNILGSSHVNTHLVLSYNDEGKKLQSYRAHQNTSKAEESWSAVSLSLNYKGEEIESLSFSVLFGPESRMLASPTQWWDGAGQDSGEGLSEGHTKEAFFRKGVGIPDRSAATRLQVQHKPREEDAQFM